MQILLNFYDHHFSMVAHLSFFFVFFLGCLTVTASGGQLPDSFSPSDNILVNCGASGNTTGQDGRTWTGDIEPKFISSLDSNTTRTTSKLDPSSSVDPVPYKIARIFHSQLTYSFPVTSGQKFIRLYFNPKTYHQELNRSNAFFNVAVGHFTLLSNFSPSLAADFIVKEFCINMEENRVLNITFAPITSNDAYGFINGIEVLSMPSSLYYSGSWHLGIPFIGHDDRFTLQNNTVLEMIHRLNVGGSSILPRNDSGLFRSWSDDTKFVLNLGDRITSRTTHINYTAIPTYAAPREVYQTARSIGKGMNLTWKLPVDGGFMYFIRFHFCELQQSTKKSGDRKFQIFIRNRMGESSAGIINWTGGNGTPVIKDYVVMLPDARNGKKNDIFIDLVPTANSHPILNGLELFKINNTQGSLCLGGLLHRRSRAPPQLKQPVHRTKKSRDTKTKLLAIIGATMGGIIFASLVGLAIFWHSKSARFSEENIELEPIPEGICRRFTAEEIRNATDNFDRTQVLGEGGCGRVYKGFIDKERTPVAIKALKPTSCQSSCKFWDEIKLLSKLRHPHLVSLIGYCEDEGFKILVYDYMAQGTLRDHLYSTNNPPLSWKQRLHICIGAARGIHYLHAGAEHAIIHRDIKSSNILLDEKWVPKVSDFGLSRLGPTSLSRSHVTTEVRGTFGYFDPEYFLTKHLTLKSDVYSFGVFLFEVLCARPAVDIRLDEDQHSLAHWAQEQIKAGTLDQIIDPNLTGQIAPECLNVYAKIAHRCLLDDRNQRPSMSNVLKKLKLALKLQESADAAAKEGILLGDEARTDQISLSDTPGDSGRMAHSCPTFWPKTMPNKVLFRFFSDRLSANLAKPPTLRGLKAFIFAVSAYKALPNGSRHSSVPV